MGGKKHRPTCCCCSILVFISLSCYTACARAGIWQILPRKHRSASKWALSDTGLSPGQRRLSTSHVGRLLSHPIGVITPRRGNKVFAFLERQKSHIHQTRLPYWTANASQFNPNYAAGSIDVIRCLRKKQRPAPAQPPVKPAHATNQPPVLDNERTVSPLAHNRCHHNHHHHHPTKLQVPPPPPHILTSSPPTINLRSKIKPSLCSV